MEYSKEFVTAVVLGKDLVPRQVKKSEFSCFSVSLFYTKAPCFLSERSQFTFVSFSYLPIFNPRLACPYFPSYLYCCVFYLNSFIDVLHTSVLAYPSPISQLPVLLKKVNILIPQLCSLWHLASICHLLSYLCCHLHICALSQVTSSEPSYTCELSPGYIFRVIFHLCTVS